jgi:hypothetical protein
MLLNGRHIVSAPSDRAFELSQHWFRILLRPRIAQVFLDVDWYLKAYPDVRLAVESGVVATARDHYLDYGYFENRMPHRIEVDEAWYLSTYVDVRKAVADGEAASAQAHFEMFGFREGRLPFSNFHFRTASAS